MSKQIAVRSEMLTVKEVAVLVNVSERTVWRMLSAGQLIRPVRMGGNTRWRRAQLDAWIEAGCPPVA